MRKVEWAKANIDLLEGEIGGFIGPKTYKVEVYPDYEAGEQDPEFVIIGEALVDPPDEALAPRIGDIVHDLRSALDHLVWTLSDNHSPAPPPPKGKMPVPWRHVSFPITFESSEWAAAVGRSLAKVDPALRARFRELQPWFTNPSAPEFSDLYCLEQLWNTDKHRHLSLVSSFVGLKNVFQKWPFQIPEPPKEWHVDFDILEQRPAGPFKRGTKVKLGRIAWRGNFWSTIPQMNMDPKLTFGIAFGEGPPAYGALVVSELRYIAETVRRTILKFDSELR